MEKSLRTPDGKEFAKVIVDTVKKVIKKEGEFKNADNQVRFYGLMVNMNYLSGYYFFYFHNHKL